jgi:acyl-lipid omega-6 desaturase (Delta-12 desaturase)
MTLLDAAPRAGTHTDPGYGALRKVKLGTVRAAFSPGVYERSHGKALGWLAVDLTLYAAFMAGVLLAPGAPLKLLFGVLAGLAVAFLFVWAHDAAHGALFGSAWYGEVLGTIAMLPSLNMYRLWIYGHNKVHHGFTSYSPIDWIWRPHSPAEYRAASRWSRLVYRVERSFAGCGVHYLLRVWWPGMVRFRPERDVRRRNHFALAKLVTAAFVAGLSALTWWVAGPIGPIAGVLVPFLVFTYVIALTVYLHHTHPRLPFFDDRKDWSASIGQVACSTVVRTPRVVEALTHNILVHTPHHVDTRIPFYRLKQAYADLKPIYGKDIVEYRFQLKTVRPIFRTCQLFDFETKTWYRFADLATLPDVIDLPAEAPAR